MDFKAAIAELIGTRVQSLSKEEIYEVLETPPNMQMGDFAFPCFKLAKEMRKAPPAIAQELAENLGQDALFAKITAAGPYVNFFLDKAVFAKETIGAVLAQGARYGGSEIGKGKTVVIDYSSPNVAKPFHIGHLRSTGIGRALYNIYSMLGYKCVGINHLGDWGTQFGKMIVAYKKWGNREEIDQQGIKGLMDLYVRFHDEAEKNPALEDEARAWFVKMQEGDEEAIALWKWINDISMQEYERIYQRLGVTFDAYTGESFYNDKMAPVVEELKEKNLLVESQGAMIVDLEEDKMPPCLIVRKDGGTLYATRDIAAAMYRKKTYNFDKALYLTALDQNLHFAQFFKVIEKMGYDYAKDMVHVPFGLVSMAEGKLSTRKGQVVFMEDLLNEAVDKTLEIINERNADLDDKQATAEMVGIGAVIFNDLYNGRIKDVVFSWERMLNFNGETGPYVQYTHTRANSILRKAAAEGIEIKAAVDFSALAEDDASAIVRQIYDLPQRMQEAADKNEPSVISRHLVGICQAFNKFYNETPILKAEESARDARLLLTQCVRDIIKSMLGVLGIQAPEKM